MLNFRRSIITFLLLPLWSVGCASSRSEQVELKEISATDQVAKQELPKLPEVSSSEYLLTAFEDKKESTYDSASPSPGINSHETSKLSHFEQMALDQNPRLIRLYQNYQAAVSRSCYADKLPDPKLGANVFGAPIETASGSQRANMSLSQTIPWLGKLNAEQQRTIFEAYAVSAEYEAEKLRVLTALRTGWYRLYVIDRQIDTTQANQTIITSLIELANARISTGKASQGDVLLGTLELSQLEERLLSYKKQRRSVEAELNRLIARPVRTPIVSPKSIRVETPKLSAEEVYQMALNSQPEIKAARLRTKATRWGIEVASLSRRPDITVSANYFLTDDNRPASPIVNVGEDPWSIGAQISIPLWRDKYDAMRNEASWKHSAARHSVQELYDRYDAIIVEILAELNRAKETASLYQSTIVPQARQTLISDQSAYTNGVVEFDRVIRDYKNVLTLELGYHNAIGDVAIAIAKLQQVAGQDFETLSTIVPIPSPSK